MRAEVIHRDRTSNKKLKWRKTTYIHTYNEILRALEAMSIASYQFYWHLGHCVYVFASLLQQVYCMYNGLFVSKGFRLGKSILNCVWYLGPKFVPRMVLQHLSNQKNTYIPLVGRCRRNWMRVETMGMPRRLTAGMAKSDFVWDTV